MLNVSSYVMGSNVRGSGSQTEDIFVAGINGLFIWYI